MHSITRASFTISLKDSERGESLVPAGAKNVQTVTDFPKKIFQTIDTIIDTSHTLNTGDMTKAQSCNNHGVLYAQMKQLDDAEECFNQALALYKRRSTQSIGMYFII